MGKPRRRETEMREIVKDFNAQQEHKNRPKVKVKTKKPLEAKTEAQGHYIVAMEGSDVTFGVGPAGTGKTYVCTKYACEALDSGKIKKIVVTRPAVEAGGGLGFLPGNIHEKFAPYFAPFKAVLEDHFGASHVENMIKNGVIEIQPLEYLRGLTFDDAFVILDEAQNTTPAQMKLFLSRIGTYSKIVINGDITQKDIPGDSGMEDALYRLKGLEGIAMTEFDEDDIVRSPLCKAIMMRYRA